MEIWKDIKGYEGYYQVSNHGRVRSLDRIIIWRGKEKKESGKIMSLVKSGCGYKYVSLSKRDERESFRVHLLVWDAFGDRPRNGRVLQVDHIDNDKMNNHIDNLTLLNNRLNCSKGKLQKEKTSKYTGVCLNKKTGKWGARATMDGKYKHLGLFPTEIQAHLAYKKALISIGEL